MTVKGSGRQPGTLPIPADHHLVPGTHRCKLTLFCEHLPIGDIHLPIPCSQRMHRMVGLDHMYRQLALLATADAHRKTLFTELPRLLRWHRMLLPRRWQLERSLFQSLGQMLCVERTYGSHPFCFSDLHRYTASRAFISEGIQITQQHAMTENQGNGLRCISLANAR